TREAVARPCDAQEWIFSTLAMLLPATLDVSAGDVRLPRDLGEIFVKTACLARRSAPLPEIDDPPDQHTPVEPDRQHVARLERVCGLVDLLAVQTDVAGLRKPGRQRARFHGAREEQPLVDALSRLAHLLLELVAQGGQLGERRVGIDPRRAVLARPLAKRLGVVIALRTLTLRLPAPLAKIALALAVAVEAARVLTLAMTLGVAVAAAVALEFAAAPVAVALAAAEAALPPDDHRLGSFFGGGPRIGLGYAGFGRVRRRGWCGLCAHGRSRIGSLRCGPGRCFGRLDFIRWRRRGRDVAVGHHIVVAETCLVRSG